MIRSFAARVKPPVREPGFCAGSRRRVRSGRRCARCGPGSRLRTWRPRAPQAAPIVDGLVSHVTVTDRHHALCGQRLRLVPIRSSRGPAYIVVELPGGRRRSLRRSVTDLTGAAEATPSAEQEAARISARTLLPLARHLAASLAASAVEVPHADRSPSAAEPTAGGNAAPAMAELVGRDASASCPASCRLGTAAGTEPSGDGELPC